MQQSSLSVINLQLCLVLTAMMTGIIWYVQIVQYPLFPHVGLDAWTTYESQYTQLAGYVIAPMMLGELFLSVSLVFTTPRIVRKWAMLSIALLSLIWMSTFLIQVPLHQSLEASWNANKFELLLQSNWIRTALWSFRLIILLRIALHLR